MLDAFNMWHLKYAFHMWHLMGIKWQDKITNNKALKRAKIGASIFQFTYITKILQYTVMKLR